MARKHGVYNTDEHFLIDVVTRTIKQQSGKSKLMQFDHNCERYEFEMPRKIDNHDMSQCDKVRIHYTNIGSASQVSSDVYNVTDLKVSPDDENVIIFSWLISQNATKHPGTLNFIIQFMCVDENGNVDYLWHTDTFKGITVSNGINNSENVIDTYSDILLEWEQRLFGNQGNTPSISVETDPTVPSWLKDVNTLDEMKDLVREIPLPDSDITSLGKVLTVGPVDDEDGIGWVLEYPSGGGDLDDSSLQSIYDLLGSEYSTKSEIETYVAGQIATSITNGIENTASGDVISINDSIEAPLRGLKLFGKTTQNGTPTPDAPVDLESVGSDGSVEVNLLGLNIVDWANPSTIKKNFTFASDGSYIQATGTGSWGSATWELDPDIYGGATLCCSSESYSQTLEGAKVAIQLVYTDSAGKNYYGGFASSQIVTTIPEDITKIYIQAICNNSGTALATENTLTVYKPLVCLASTATAGWEEYKEKRSITTSTPDGLPGIPVSTGGNYTDGSGQQWTCDEIDFGRGVYVRRVGRIESYAGESVGSVWLSSTGELSNGAAVQYVLTEAIETVLPEGDLAAYAMLHTNKPVTTVINDSGAGMSIGYVADIKTYVDNNAAVGEPGKDGHTPIKGKDYWTEEDQNQIVDQITASITNGIENTASGDVFSVNDSTEAPLRGLKLFGKTVQNGTPTPEAPVELVSAGSNGHIGIAMYGKNLFSFQNPKLNGVSVSEITDGIRVTSTVTAGYAAVAYKINIPLNSETVGKKITASAIAKAGSDNTPAIRIEVYDSTNTRLDYVTTSGNGALTTTYEIKNSYVAEGNYLQLRLYTTYSGTGGIDLYSDFTNVQIELGAVATDYEVYKEAGSIEVSTPNGLPGIPVSTGGNYTDSSGQQWVCDEIDFERGIYVQRVAMLPLTGTEMGTDGRSWHKESQNADAPGNILRFSVTGFLPRDLVAGSGVIFTGMCSHFTPITANAGFLGMTVGVSVTSSGMLNFYSEQVDPNSFIAWMKAQHSAGMPVTVYYSLPEPVETELPDGYGGDYTALRSFKPITTAINDSGAGMQIGYTADTKAYIDNKFAQLAAAMVNNV